MECFKTPPIPEDPVKESCLDLPVGALTPPFERLEEVLPRAGEDAE
jgi:hypothetical protein